MNKLVEIDDKIKKVQERIAKFEKDLRQPLKRDLEDNAVEEGSRQITYSLYQIEKKNLEIYQAQRLALV